VGWIGGIGGGGGKEKVEEAAPRIKIDWRDLLEQDSQLSFHFILLFSRVVADSGPRARRPMSLLHSIRSSPSYLFIKCYLICTLVTLFAARPLSSRLNANGPWTWYESTEGGHGMSSWGRMQALLASATRREGRASMSSNVDRTASATGAGAESSAASGGTNVGGFWWQERRFPFLFPPPQIPLSLPPPVRLPRIPLFERWRLRWHDMSHLRRLVAHDDKDVETFPELEWDAQVRCSSDLHADEKSAMRKRRLLMSSEGTNALAQFLQLPSSEYVHPDDVPLIAIGGSGGGYRAMFGYAGFLKEAENTGLLQCTMWSSAVSGSCWTLAVYYTIAQCSTDVMIAHLLAMAHEEAHPMSLHAMDRVARSSRGIYYLLGPLLRKSRNKTLHCRIMDFYATLVLSYQFLPRPLSLFGTDYSYNGPDSRREPSLQEHAMWAKYEPSEGLSRKSFQWSKVWTRAKLNEGLQPIPILTGVRRVWRPYSKAEVTVADNVPGHEKTPLVGSGYDWYEISPLELGCRNIGAWIPTWAYGRAFENGQSKHRGPEEMLASIVGQCTGAPAGPLTAYISTLLASIPQGTVMSTLLKWVNNFVMMKQWEKRWGNPIRAADEPNPFYGRGQDDVIVDMGPTLEKVEPPASTVTHSPRASSPGPAEAQQPRISRPTSKLHQPSESAQASAPTEPNLPYTPSQQDVPYERESNEQASPSIKRPEPAHTLPWEMRHTGEQINAFLANLPRLPELAMEHTLRPRRDSGASASTSLYEHDPETFMAPIEDLEDVTPTFDENGEGQPAADQPSQPRSKQWRWEHTRRLRLMDSGLSNNLPNHVLARDERQADVIISFDASSDVKTGAAVARIHEFGKECGIEIKKRELNYERPRTDGNETTSGENRPGRVANGSVSPSELERHYKDEADKIREEYEPLSAQRFDGWRMKKNRSTDRAPDVHFVYCPLLPNAVQPGFDPTTAHYSTSYNLIWTADQVRALLRTAMANVEENSYAVGVIRDAVREAYENKKKARLTREAQLRSMYRPQYSHEMRASPEPMDQAQDRCEGLPLRHESSLNTPAPTTPDANATAKAAPPIIPTATTRPLNATPSLGSPAQGHAAAPSPPASDPLSMLAPPISLTTT